MPASGNPTVILVVDDEPKIEPMFKLRFRKKIASGEFSLLFALSAKQALSMLEQHPEIDMVLLDINMPGMDGLTLLPKLIAFDDALRVVMVSAYGDMKNIRQAMNLGAFDFVTKPIDFKDLNTTIGKTLKEVELSKRARITKELEEKNKALRELDQLKSRFFTNISHEFRTPLTAILGTTDQIKQDPEQWLQPGIPIIERNGRLMLDLVTQVLDLRKLETGKLEIRTIRSDIVGFIQYLLESFYPLMENKEIQLDFECAAGELITDFDPAKLTSVLSNLLSNAFKYTPRGGSVTVRLKMPEEGLRIEVQDSGIGISPEALPRIFDRFFRVLRASDAGGGQPHNNSVGPGGTGIGLALARELVELMGGRITAESERGKGSTFQLMLPIKPLAVIQQEKPVKDVPASRQLPASETVISPDHYLKVEERPTLLIIEDNMDVATYLRACLEEDYLIQLAWDGQEGIDYALEHVPDIIISDVMMPGKDGYELCDTLKNDRRTSHIPIILLTARADTDSRIEGLEKGADAYLAKPFNQQELFVRLSKLLEIRKKLQDRYRSPENLPDAGDHPQNLEDEFLVELRRVIEDNLDDEHFRVPELCRAIGVSRTQLHRKVKALTDLSTTNFVRNVRLQKARTLLESTNLNITQVAFEVGFADARYFSRTYHELFGHSPSDERK